MKIVHISTTDYGGAFRATERIHKSMLEIGISSKILVRTKSKKDTPAEMILDNNIKIFFSKCKNFLNLVISRSTLIMSDYFGTDISKNENIREADIIILHAVNAFISYKGFERLCGLNKPILWVVHDMSLFTGGCHYDMYCGKYKSRCGKCHLISSSRERDITYYNLKRKMWMARYKNFKVIGPSKWISECARESSILSGIDVITIANPIDINLFKPMKKIGETGKFKIDRNKKNILFGATRATNNPIKGIKYLREALNKMDINGYRLLIFGNQETEKTKYSQMETVYLGTINDDEELVRIYNAADVFVAPSEQDNYPGTVLEAAACGTPAVAFRIGGMPDIIQHKESGYLAEYKNVEDLMAGIEYCAKYTQNLGNKARLLTEQRNSYEIIASQYIKVVDSMLKK